MRAAAGLALAGAVAVAGWRAGALSASGAAAAVAVGALCIAAGWSWGALLIAFFLTSTALSRARAEGKAVRTAPVVAKVGARDAVQVLANGGLFAAAALLSVLAPWDGWTALAAGALGTATADTWATEVGTLAAAPPRSIVTGRPVPVGTSGGVTVAGTLAAVGGAGFIAAAALLAGWPSAAGPAALVGGVAGATADSLLGATIQARRWCARCRVGTERPIHSCGEPTRVVGGVPWLDNDGVNLLSGGIGAAVATIWAP